MAMFNGGYNAYANPYQQYGVAPNYGYQQQPQPQQFSQNQNGPAPMFYVHGIEGANAFQIPQGYTKVTLWDEDNDSFYVKGYDNNGIPRVLAWNDYHPHVEETKKDPPQVDMTQYATKDDIKSILSSFDFSSFLTKKEFDDWRTGKDRESK